MNKILFPIIIIFELTSCSNSNNPSQMDSDDYDTKEERVEAMKKEIKSFSDFENAEFELFNVNGFSNSRIALPGASSWDYKFVIKINPLEIDKWTKGMTQFKPDEYNTQWMSEIIQKRKSEWVTVTQPEFYNREGNIVTMIVYRSEGIIFKRVVNR